MKTILGFAIIFLAACGNRTGTDGINADSSNMITDSAALMKSDTTTVLGTNHIGEGQMKTDTPIASPNSAH